MTFISTPLLRLACLTALLLAVQILLPRSALAELNLESAEELALDADPAILASQARASALQDQAIADGQLPDPKLFFSLRNVPLDDFSMKREGMSQAVAGIRQSFPRGRSLHYQQQRTQWLSKAETAAMENTRRTIRSDVRQSYLELYYQEQAADIVDRTRGLFEQLVEITRAHYASGRVSQQDVLLAQLELSRLDDKATQILAQADVQRATLSRWIGQAAWQPLASGFPRLPELPTLAALRASLTQHPAITAASAEVEASQQSVNVAREQYKPGFDVGLDYNKRFGNLSDGRDRPDMATAMVTLDVPIFTNKRQDKRLSASQQQADAAMQVRERKLRELQRSLAADYARWRRLGTQVDLYRKQLLRESTANAEAAVNAYQSGINEFNTLMRARIVELDVRLQDLRLRVDREKTQARLLYLAAPIASATPNLSGEDQ